MLNNVNTSVERIVGKLDNDFNLDNSDWIPRVGAWVIDAMSQLKVMRTTPKRKQLRVQDRIAYSECPIDKANVKVYDSKGCEIVKASSQNQCGSCSSTGNLSQSIDLTPNTVDIVNNAGTGHAPDAIMVNTVNAKDYPDRYNVVYQNYHNTVPRNYVWVTENTLELNFDTDCITIEQDMVDTVYSEMYGCDLPVIPDNGLLVEAIGYYCMYRMLTRGYKHPVFNLGASQYGTNPKYEWEQLKQQAQRSVIIDKQGKVIKDGGLWRSSFFVTTFNPKK